MLAIIFFSVIFGVGILAGTACFMFFSNSSAELADKGEQTVK